MDIQAAQESVAKFGNRRLLFGLILADTPQIVSILAALESLPEWDDNDDNEHWVRFCSNVQAGIEELIEDLIDQKYPGFAWEYMIADGKWIH